MDANNVNNNIVDMARIYLSELLEGYNQAVEDDKKIFVFRDREILTAYAKYLIEYVDRRGM